MAEVSWKLSRYGLSALKRSQKPSLSTAENHGTVSATCIIGARNRRSKVAEGQLAWANSLPSTRTCKPENFKNNLLLDKEEAEHRAQRHSRRKSQMVHGPSPCSWASVTPCHLLVLDFDAKIVKLTSIQNGKLVYEHQPTPCLPPCVTLPPLSQVNHIVGRMTCWSSKGFLVATFQPDTFGSAQQVRSFSTVILLDGSGPRVSPLRPSPAILAAPPCRAYSWGNNDGDSDPPPPLYRSRTAYYDILRVTPNATRAQVKTAYYKQSFLYHPDKNPGSKEATLRFSEITEAYNVLGSVALRRKYDRGILSQADVHGAGRPSTRETASPSKASTAQQGQGQGRQPRHYYSNSGGKPIFDFDAFYKAHYGDQLQKERQMKARKEMDKKKKEDDFKHWKQEKMTEMTVGFLLVFGGVVLISLRG